MFDDFSFAPSATLSDTAMDDALPSPRSRGVPASLDEGYCSSVSDSIADLSTRFDRHSLRPRDGPTHLPHHASFPYHHPSSSIPPLRAPPPSNHLHSVRHQRQLATRRQCSTENLSRISHLVERMLQDGDAHGLSSRSAARIAHQRTYLPAGVMPSIAATPSATNHESSSSCSSPLSPTSSTNDSESDYSRAARSHEHLTASAARPWSSVEPARSRRKDAVEKTVRMRKRPSGKTARRKD
ncbi:hypothetical protein MMC17_006644 [Xylographa soralifera]|nr:hypothetical protein [Xylographa soralifera]